MHLIRLLSFAQALAYALHSTLCDAVALLPSQFPLKLNCSFNYPGEYLI